MRYVQAASMGYNAARSACRNSLRLTGVGKRRTFASMNQFQCFNTGEDISSMNRQKTDRMSGMGVFNFSSRAGDIVLSISGDGSNRLKTNSQHINFLEALECSEEDDGG
mmetsp:Transcript_23175/g.54704  ORF Transcript_23175/g.54704 Transcript_23175/m.54704 type:complete len:109 (+) Transcript_23175:192-518(+)